MSKIVNNYISVDCVIFGYDNASLKVLLLERVMLDNNTKNVLFNDKILPGSHVFEDESLEDAAHRVLKEYAGIEGIYLQQFKTFGDANRLSNQEKDKKWLDSIKQDHNKRVITVGFYSLINANQFSLSLNRIQTHPEFFQRNPAWYDLSEITENMAYDHYQIMQEALKYLRDGVKYNPLVFELLPEKYSLGLLQKIYETILGTTFDKRNFRRKLLKMPYIVALNEKQQSVSHKPAQLYGFDKKKYWDLKKNNHDIMF